MNLRRGLFRIWIIASVAWALYMGWQAYQSVGPYYEAVQRNQEASQNNAAAFEAWRIRSADQQCTNPTTLFGVQTMPAFCHQPTEQPLQELPQIQAEFFADFLYAVAVPAALIVLWLLSGWVATGFRPSAK